MKQQESVIAALTQQLEETTQQKEAQVSNLEDLVKQLETRLSNIRHQRDSDFKALEKQYIGQIELLKEEIEEIKNDYEAKMLAASQRYFLCSNA